MLSALSASPISNASKRPRSVDEFPQPEEFLTILAAAGFRDCRARSQSFGIAQIYTAEKC
mgnify:CR=1 FL=1